MTSTTHGAAGRLRAVRWIEQMGVRAASLPEAVVVARATGASAVVGALFWLMTGLAVAGPSIQVRAAVIVSTAAVGLLLWGWRGRDRLVPISVSLGAPAAAQTLICLMTGEVGSPYLSGFIGLVAVVSVVGRLRTASWAVGASVSGIAINALADGRITPEEVVLTAMNLGVLLVIAVSLSQFIAGRRVESRRLARRLQRAERVSDRRRVESLTDPLTGLGNRRAFERDLATVAERYGSQLVLVFADLDGLKAINDRHGHPAGDMALRLVAERLRDSLRPGDRAYRIGGDEFAALVIAPAEDSVRRRLRDGLSATVPDVGFVQASVGVGRFRAGESAADLLARVDGRLYEHKGRRPRPPLTIAVESRSHRQAGRRT